jgi:hypothetical protein
MDWAERLAAVLGLAALVVLPACSGGSSGKGATKAVQPARQPCRASGLALKVGRYGEAGGQFIQTFTFTNVSGADCRLGGWPGFRVLEASRRLVPTQRVRQNAPGRPAWRSVVVPPNRSASFDVYGADFDAARDVACPKTSSASITVPNDSAEMSVRLRIPNCGRFLVAPLLAGSIDRDSWSSVVG